MASVKKKGRTIRLTPDMDIRLVALCAHLGVNPNSYMIAEVGKAVARDEVSFTSKERVNAVMNDLQALVRREAQAD